MTLATDYLLALVAAITGVLIVRASAGQSSRRAWGAAFLAASAAAALGGTHHGFALELLWTPTVLVIGVASAGMLVGSAFATMRGPARRAVLLFTVLELAVFALWMLSHDSYGWVIVDSAGALVVVALLHAARWREPPSRWILGGAAVSAAAAVVQAARIAPHPAFNHNDLYHLIQIGALLLFYQGARIMVDRR